MLSCSSACSLVLIAVLGIIGRGPDPWSSAAAHVGGADATGLLDLRAWRTMHDEDDWRERLQRREDDDLLAAIRLTTHRGRPLASDKFVRKLESTLGRRLRPLPGGRPGKQ